MVGDRNRLRKGLKQMLDITEAARDKIRVGLEAQGSEGPLRVYLQDGCGGSHLVLGPSRPEANDEVFEVGGIDYLVNRFLLQRTGRIRVDWVDDGIRRGLLVLPEKPLQEMESCPSGCSC